MSLIAGFTTFSIGQLAYNVFDDGVANVLGVTTLKHGTNPLSNVLIRLHGGNSHHGMHSMGSTENFTVDNARFNYFYLFKEDPIPIYGDAKTHFLAAAHSIMAGANFTAKMISYIPGTDTIFSNKNIITRVLSIFKYALCTVGGISSIFLSPILRFRFTKIDPSRIENDARYSPLDPENSVAYRTKQVVEPWRLGLAGSLLTGLNSGWYERAKANPLKILGGVVQITAAVGIALLYANAIAAQPHLAIAGAMMA